MTTGLLVILALILIMPFTVKSVEHNLEYFLFLMGLLSAITAGSLSTHLLSEILENRLLYFVTFAVLVTGLLFTFSVDRVKSGISLVLEKLPFPVFIFLVIVVLGLASSIITAIVASLVLVEIIHVLPIGYNAKTRLAVTSCFSIGLGAALTPLGEPLATIALSKLDAGFWYLLNQLGIYVLPGIIVLGIFGALTVRRDAPSIKPDVSLKTSGDYAAEAGKAEIGRAGTVKEVFTRTFKIFMFIIALELLGSGFKPLIDIYVVRLDSALLYWINMISAVLDNATMAAAEISPAMSTLQVKAVLMGLLVSGGMLIPGNIPNIVCASKLKIKSRDWAITGIPVGLTIMAMYFAAIFLI